MGKPSELIFTKSWLKREDFPTYEASEDNVREDMQYLHDETANAFNNLVNNEFLAENMTFAPYSGIQETDVQHAIQYVYNQIGEIGEGSVTDGAITSIKLHQVEGEEAVTTETIRDGAITTDKIDNEQVTVEKLAPDVISTISASLTIPPLSIYDGNIVSYEVKERHLATDAVTRDKIKNGEVVQGKLGQNAVKEENILTGAVTEDKLFKTSPNQAVSTQTIRDNAITYDKLRKTSYAAGQEAVDTGAIRSNAVTSDKLKKDSTGADAAVVTNAICNGAVTYAKLSDEVKGMIHTGIGEDEITYAMLKKGPTTPPGQEAVGKDAIRDGAVTENKIDNGAVTVDKLASDVISTIQAGITVAPGSIGYGELKKVDGQEAVGTLAVQDHAISFDKLKHDVTGQEAVDTDVIRDDAVTSDKLKKDVSGIDAAVVTNAICNGAVTTEKIYYGAVTSDKLCQTSPYQAVSTATIQDNAITYEKLKKDQSGVESAVGTYAIRNGAITFAKLCQELGDEAVDTGAIRDGAITYDKLYQEEGDEAVRTSAIQNGAVTFIKTSGVQKQHTMVGPITVATSAWSSNAATVSVTGVSLTNVATQKVDWTPASDADWQIVSDCKVRCDRVPPSNNNVTLRCTTTPTNSISLYFSIFD